MKKRKLSLLIGALLSASTLPAVAGTIVVNVNDEKQQFQGTGGTIDSYLGHWISLSSENRKKAARMLAEDINFDTVKNYINGTYETHQSSYDNFAQAVSDLKAVNPELKVQISIQDLPDSLERKDSDGKAIKGEHDETLDNIYQDIGQYYFDVIKAFHDLGVTVDELDLLNEPGGVKYAIYYGNRFDQSVNKLKELVAAEDGIEMPKIVGPSLWSVSGATKWIDAWQNGYEDDAAIPNAWDNLDIVSVHGYSGGWIQADYESVNAITTDATTGVKKPYYNNEQTAKLQQGDGLFEIFGNDEPDYIGDVSIALRISDAVNGGVNKFYIFNANNSSGNNAALIRTPFGGTPSKSKVYSGFKQVTSTQPDDSIVITSTETGLNNTRVVSFKDPFSEISYVNVTNVSSDVMPVTLSLEDGNHFLGITSIEAWVSDENLDESKVLDFSPMSARESIKFEASPYSVTTFKLGYDSSVAFTKILYPKQIVTTPQALDIAGNTITTTGEGTGSSNVVTVIDGKSETSDSRWVNKSNDDLPVRFDIELDQEVTLSQLAIYNGDSGGYKKPIHDFTIYDKENNELFSILGNTKTAGEAIEFPELVTTDKFSIEITRTEDKRIRLFEIELYSVETVEPIQNLASVDGSSTLTWDALGDGYSYNVYQVLDDGGHRELASNLTSTSFDFSNVLKNGSHRLAVQGVDGDGAEKSYTYLDGVNVDLPDVASPDVISPDDIIVSTFKSIESIDLGVAFAYDEEDGGLEFVSALADGESGFTNNLESLLPLGIGSHTIEWLARDSDGNESAVSQQVTVNFERPIINPEPRWQAITSDQYAEFSAESKLNDTYTADKAFDGKESESADRWLSDRNKTETWVAGTLSSEQNIVGYRVITHGDSTLNDFELQYEKDGNWITFDSITGFTGKEYLGEVSQTLDKVRLLVNKHTSNGGIVRLYELTLFTENTGVANVVADNAAGSLTWDSEGEGVTYNVYEVLADGQYQLLAEGLDAAAFSGVGMLAPGEHNLAIEDVSAEGDLGGFAAVTLTVPSSGDETAPVLTTPDDVSFTFGPEGLPITNPELIPLGVAAATDDVSDVANIQISNNLHAMLPLGEGVHDITWTATDENFNTSQSVQKLTIVDNSIIEPDARETNLALNKPVTVNAAENLNGDGVPKFNPSNIVNGDLDTNGQRWVNKNDRDLPVEFEFDLESVQEIDGMRMYNGYNGYGKPINDFTIYSNSNGVWIEEFKIEGNEFAAGEFIQFPKTLSTDKVKMEITKTFDSRIRLYEVELIQNGKGVENLAPRLGGDSLLTWDSFGDGYTYNVYQILSDGRYKLLAGNLVNPAFVNDDILDFGDYELAVEAVGPNDEKSGWVTTQVTVSQIDNSLPVFDPLPDIVVEATGPLTDVALPAVQALDFGQPINAVADITGEDLPLGETTVVWTATGSQNVSMAEQLIRIVDNTDPVFGAPALATVDATGVHTVITADNVVPPIAMDLVDGNLTGELAGNYALKSGQHDITWQVIDDNGNAASVDQSIIIKPLVQIADGTAVSAGSTITVPVELSGSAAIYPVVLTASVPEGSPITLESTEIRINEGTAESSGLTGEITATIGETATSSDVLEIMLTDAGDNAVLGERTTASFTLVDENVAPIVKLSVSQKGVETSTLVRKDEDDKAYGEVTVTAQIEDGNVGENHNITWSSNSSDVSLPETGSATDADNISFTFKPGDVTGNIVEFTAIVTEVKGDQDDTSPLTSTSTVRLQVLDTSPLKDTEDSDGDGIFDTEEGLVDTDGDGIADYKDTNSDTTQLVIDDSSEPLQTEENLSLRLGKTKLAAEGHTAENASITLDDLADHGGSQGGKVDKSVSTVDLSFDPISEIVDFEVSGFNVAGESVKIVLPLSGDNTIPENAFYRKFTGNDGWSAFVEDDHNMIHSAPKVSETCPEVGDAAYTPGLTVGDACVQLTIQDGGENDADGVANGSISDPGVVAKVINVAPTAVVAEETIKAGAGDTVVLDGSGSFDFEADSNLSFVWEQKGLDDADAGGDAGADAGGDAGADADADAGADLAEIPSDKVDLLDHKTDTASFVVPTGATRTLEFTLTVKDEDEAISTADVVVEVTQKPVITITKDKDNLVRGEVVTLDASASTDPDDDTLTYKWSQLETDSTQGVFEDATSAVTTFTAPVANQDTDLTLMLEVSDGKGGISTEEIVIPLAKGNNIPTVSDIPNQTVTQGEWVYIDAEGADADGDELEYTWTQVSGPTITVLTGFDTPNLSFIAQRSDDMSEYVFEVKVEDKRTLLNESKISAADEESQVTTQTRVTVEPREYEIEYDKGGSLGWFGMLLAALLPFRRRK